MTILWLLILGFIVPFLHIFTGPHLRIPKTKRNCRIWKPQFPAYWNFCRKWNFIINFFRSFIGLVIIGYASYIVVEVVLVSPQNLVSGLGYVIYVLLFYIFSAAPGKVGSATSCWCKKPRFRLCRHLSLNAKTNPARRKNRINVQDSPPQCISKQFIDM